MENSSNFRNIRETYRIEKTLGKGSFATVKRAKHRVSGEKVAVKIFKKTKMNEVAILQEIEILL
jgi:serine/threonine protein kinase